MFTTLCVFQDFRGVRLFSDIFAPNKAHIFVIFSVFQSDNGDRSVILFIKNMFSTVVTLLISQLAKGFKFERLAQYPKADSMVVASLVSQSANPLISLKLAM